MVKKRFVKKVKYEKFDWEFLKFFYIIYFFFVVALSSVFYFKKEPLSSFGFSYMLVMLLCPPFVTLFKKLIDKKVWYEEE